MSSLFINVLHRFGVDKAVAYSSGSKVVGGIAGVISIFFITSFLTGVEQGYYYTFGSILALQVFFELGLTGIMTQFVAHEASHLTLNNNGEFVGERVYQSRLASLVRFCLKWYTVLAVLVLIVLIVVGELFFSKYGEGHGSISWRFPWILVCIGTAIKLFQSPFVSILSGMNYVKEMSEIGFWQQILIPLFTWGGLVLGLKLTVVGIGYLVSVLVWQYYVCRKGLWRLLVRLMRVEVIEKVSYLKEIFPFQWRIALSWISGYFTFQLFNPVLFATEGATVAGQMGMTLQVLNAIQSFSLSWLNTKIPLYSRLIALKDYIALDDIFLKTLKQMMSVCLLLLSFVFTGIALLYYTRVSFHGTVLANRFLPLLPTGLLIVPVILQQLTNSWATYLRCHKQEPYLLLSVCSGVANLVSVFLLGNLYGLYGIVIGYVGISIITFPWGYYIYKEKKVEWHG